MNLKTALRKSVKVSPAETALRRADNTDDLEALWIEHCDAFPDESEEREYLLSIFDERLVHFKAAAAVAKALRV